VVHRSQERTRIESVLPNPQTAAICFSLGLYSPAAARSFGAHLQNIVGWRFPNSRVNTRSKIANAHCGSVCQLLCGQIVMKISAIQT